MSHNISTKEIKTFVVVLKDNTVKVGEIIIPAPIGVGIDPKTGELTVPIQAVPVGDVVLNPRLEDKLLINEGFVKIKLIFENPHSGHCHCEKDHISKLVIVPIQSIDHSDLICSDYHIQEKVDIKFISVMGIPDYSTPTCAGKKINLLIKVVLDVKFIISQEDIISIPVLGEC